MDVGGRTGSNLPDSNTWFVAVAYIRRFRSCKNHRGRDVAEAAALRFWFKDLGMVNWALTSGGALPNSTAEGEVVRGIVIDALWWNG